MDRGDKEPIEGVKLVNGRLDSNDFKAIQGALGLNNIQMGAQLGMSSRIVSDMRSGSRNVALWTQKLLEFIVKENELVF